MGLVYFKPRSDPSFSLLEHFKNWKFSQWKFLRTTSKPKNIFSRCPLNMSKAIETQTKLNHFTVMYAVQKLVDMDWTPLSLDIPLECLF